MITNNYHRALIGAVLAFGSINIPPENFIQLTTFLDIFNKHLAESNVPTKNRTFVFGLLQRWMEAVSNPDYDRRVLVMDTESFIAVLEAKQIDEHSVKADPVFVGVKFFECIGCKGVFEEKLIHTTEDGYMCLNCDEKIITVNRLNWPSLPDMVKAVKSEVGFHFETPINNDVCTNIVGVTFRKLMVELHKPSKLQEKGSEDPSEVPNYPTLESCIEKARESVSDKNLSELEEHLVGTTWAYIEGILERAIK